MEILDDTRRLQVKTSYADVINRHGYGFQYSVLSTANKLSIAGTSTWQFQAAEFPVEVKGYGTRIDFILRRRGEPPSYLLAECKRANPALSNWWFARAPYVHRARTPSHEPVIIEHIESDYEGTRVLAYASEQTSAHNPCHIGLEVRSTLKGDTQGESGKAIENASTQVLRGLNGMIEMLTKNRHIVSEWKRADFLPVIFTTAQLWISDVELLSADVSDGRVNLNHSNFTLQPWVSYQYHQSSGIKHSTSPGTAPSDLGKLMQSEYIRTIPIVNSSGIASFLEWSSRFDLS